MCGICGQIYFNKNPMNSENIQSMMALIKHRGPDNEDCFIDQNVGLGHVRLSIIDLSSTGHQPMFSLDKRYCILHNGEVYNYLELREQLKGKYKFISQTDTEVILYSFIEWGPACLTKFNGMFAFVIYDTKTKELFATRDRFGIKPFYYFIDDQRFIFASEERAIIPFLKEKKPNNKAIFEYLIYNRTDQGNFTFFEGIEKLPHGAYGIISDRKFRIKKWYMLEKELREPFKSPYEFYETFRQSIKFRLRSDVPVGLCLSGGLDSSSIVSVLLKDFNKSDLNTFSAVYEKSDRADESDFINEYRSDLENMYYTKPTAESLMTDLTKFIECHSEPVATLGPYAQFKVMQLAKEHVKVTLDGQGADEELAGYHYFFGAYFKELLSKGKFASLSSEIMAYLMKYQSLLAIGYLGLYVSPPFFKNYLSKISHDFATDKFYQTEKKGSDVRLNLYNPKNLNESLLQHFEYKLEHLLKWEDHNSMWHAIESRVPFLDHNMVERTLSLPSEKIINKATTKVILREAMKGILPEKIRGRQDKIGFATPWEKWFRTENFKKLILEILSSKSFKERGYLNPEKCIKAYQSHLDNKVNIAKEIWKWINLELWFQKFVD